MFTQRPVSVEHRLRSVGARMYLSPCAMSSGGQRKMEIKFQANATVVDETLEDNAVTAIRLCNLHPSDLTQYFFLDYTRVTRLEVGCPVCIRWLFKHLSFMQNLRTVRFGRGAFDYVLPDTEEEDAEEGRACSGVIAMEINASYDASRQDVQQVLMFIVNVNQALKLACNYFPGLRQCDLVIPTECEPKLHSLLGKFPEIKKAGCMYADYATSVIRFYTKNYNSSTERRAGNLADPRTKPKNPTAQSASNNPSSHCQTPPRTSVQQPAAQLVMPHTQTILQRYTGATVTATTTSHQNQEQAQHLPPSVQIGVPDVDDLQQYSNGTRRTEAETKFCVTKTIPHGSSSIEVADDNDIHVVYATPAISLGCPAFRINNQSSAREKPYCKKTRGRGYTSVKTEGPNSGNRPESPSLLTQDWG